MAEQLTEERRATLRALCDTIVPSIERADDPTGLWGRKATDVGVDLAIEEALPTLPAEQRDGLFQLLDGLAAQGMAGLSQPSREQLLRNTMFMGSANAVGVRSIIATILFLAYGLPDPETGSNPFWAALEYPGPPAMTPTLGAADHAARPRAGRDHARGRRLCGRLGIGRRRDRRRARQGRPQGGRARGRRLRRGQRLHRLRAAGLPGLLLARRPDADRRPQRQRSTPARRSAAARRSTGPTRCARPTGCASSGHASTGSKASTAPTTTATSTS